MINSSILNILKIVANERFIFNFSGNRKSKSILGHLIFYNSLTFLLSFYFTLP